MHCQDRNSLPIPCSGFLDEEKNDGKSHFEKHLNQKFPGIPAPFPAGEPKSAGFEPNS
jgi:hypothetical protein